MSIFDKIVSSAFNPILDHFSLSRSKIILAFVSSFLLGVFLFLLGLWRFCFLGSIFEFGAVIVRGH